MPDGDPTPTPESTSAPEPKTFTQEDVDRIVQERVARVKREAPPDYEDLRAKAAKLEEIEQAQLSELEKANKAREKAEQEAAKAIERANRQLVEAAVLTEATKQKALKPEHMHRLIDTSSVTIGDDGQVAGAEGAVKAFLEANPEYVGKGRVADPVDQGARGGPTPGQLTRDDLKSMTPAEIVKAQQDGLLNDLLGINK